MLTKKIDAQIMKQATWVSASDSAKSQVHLTLLFCVGVLVYMT